MKTNVWLRILAGLVLLLAVAGLTFLAYQSGVNHTAMVVSQTSGETVPAPYPYYYGWFWPPFLFPFGCFIPLIVLFLIMLAFSAFRYMMGGAGWRAEHRMHRHFNRWGYDPENGVPPVFEEWHKRAHGQSPVEQNQK